LSDEVESGFEDNNEPIDLTGIDAKSQSEERLHEDAEISITGCLTNDKDGEIIAVESAPQEIDDWQPPTPPADPLAPIVVQDGYETCGVCLDPWGYDDNQILYCDGCDLPVHQHCYGVPEIPEGDWYCQACSAQLTELNGRNGGTELKPATKAEWWGNSKECELCLSKPKKIKWALSKIAGKKGDKEKRFCHVLCAQFVSETWFKDAANCSKVENVDNVQPRRTFGTCSFCGENHGVKVLCSIKSCTECFHAPCGLAWGCELDDVASLTDTYSNRVVYCIAHRPKVIKAGNNARLKRELEESQNIKMEANRNALGWNWKNTGGKKNRGRQRADDKRKQTKKPVVQAKTKSRHSAKKKKKRRLVAPVESESDTESDIVLPEVDAEVLSQSYRHVRTRSSGPAPLEPLSIKAARKFAPATREPINKKKKAQKRKREHLQSTTTRKKSNHPATKKSASSTLSIPKNISARGLPNSEDGRRKLAAFEQMELSRLSKKSQIRDSLPKHLLSSNARKISSEPPPLEPRGGHKKKAKLVSSFEKKHSEKPRIRSSYGRRGSEKDRIREPRRKDSYDRRDRDRERDRDDRGRDRDRTRKRDRDRRSPKRSSDISTRPATKRPPQRPPSTIPVTINTHADPRKMDPRSMSRQMMDPRKMSHMPPPPPPPKPFVEAPPVIPTNIGFAPPASRPIIVNQPITSFSMPPPAPSQKIWQGKMCKSPACDEFAIYLKLLAGEETISQLALANDADLKLKGRIKFDTLASYIPAMKKSSRKKIFLVEVHPGGSSETQAYNKFCQHYRELRRGAVIDLEKSHGVTMYIMPVIDDLSPATLSAIRNNFNCFPPKGVMWGVVVQFPEVLTVLKGDIVERHVRVQPSAKEIKSRVITKNNDPRAADPRARAAPTQVDDEVMEALRKLQELG